MSPRGCCFLVCFSALFVCVCVCALGSVPCWRCCRGPPPPLGVVVAAVCRSWVHYGCRKALYCNLWCVCSLPFGAVSRFGVGPGPGSGGGGASAMWLCGRAAGVCWIDILAALAAGCGVCGLLRLLPADGQSFAQLVRSRAHSSLCASSGSARRTGGHRARAIR